MAAVGLTIERIQTEKKKPASAPTRKMPTFMRNNVKIPIRMPAPMQRAACQWDAHATHKKRTHRRAKDNPLLVLSVVDVDSNHNGVAQPVSKEEAREEDDGLEQAVPKEEEHQAGHDQHSAKDCVRRLEIPLLAQTDRHAHGGRHGAEKHKQAALQLSHLAGFHHYCRLPQVQQYRVAKTGVLDQSGRRSGQIDQSGTRTVLATGTCPP